MRLDSWNTQYRVGGGSRDQFHYYISLEFFFLTQQSWVCYSWITPKNNNSQRNEIRQILWAIFMICLYIVVDMMTVIIFSLARMLENVEEMIKNSFKNIICWELREHSEICLIFKSLRSTEANLWIFPDIQRQCGRLGILQFLMPMQSIINQSWEK